MNGLIDIHSHILPLVDDGAESVEMALLMLKKAAEEGIEKRRISFYERNGFCYNPYPYTQPSIAPGRKPIPLRIMTYQRTVTEAEYQKIKNLLYRRVYHVSEQQMKY